MTTSDNSKPREPSRLAPNSVEAEEALLGSILIDPDAMLDLDGKLAASDFFIVKNALIFEALERLYRRGESIDYLTAIEELRGMGQLEEVGGPAYLTYLLNHTPSSLYAEAYGELVKRSSYRRQVLTGASTLAQAAYDEERDAFAVQEAVEAAVEQLREALPPQDDYLAGRDALLYYTEIMHARTEEDAPESLGMPWEPLSRYVAGVTPGKVVLVSGFSGEGKTIVLEELCEWVAMTGGRPFYITTELTRADMLDRMVCRHTGIPYHDLIAKTTDAQRVIRELGRKVSGWIGNIDYWETNGASARAIFGQIKRAIRKGRRYIFIDYLSEAVGFDTTQRQLKDAIDGFFRTIHTTAKQTGVTFFIASQQTPTDQGPRVFGSSVPNQKSALHIRLETEKAKESRIYTVDNRLIPVREGDISPMMRLVVEKNTFGPSKVAPALFRDGARYRFLDETQVSFTPAFSDDELDEAAAHQPVPMQSKLDLDLKPY